MAPTEAVIWRRERTALVKGAALTGDALGPDVASVLLGDAAADGQTEAGAAFISGVGGVYLSEALEDCL